MLVGHGSRTRGFDTAMRKVAQALKRTGRYRDVRCGFLEASRPSIPRAIFQCVRRGAREVSVLPYFVLTGKHVTRDIPNLVAEEAKKYRGQARIVLCPYLGYHPGLVWAARRRLREGHAR